MWFYLPRLVLFYRELSALTPCNITGCSLDALARIVAFVAHEMYILLTMTFIDIESWVSLHLCNTCKRITSAVLICCYFHVCSIWIHMPVPKSLIWNHLHHCCLKLSWAWACTCGECVYLMWISACWCSLLLIICGENKICRWHEFICLPTLKLLT